MSNLDDIFHEPARVRLLVLSNALVTAAPPFTLLVISTLLFHKDPTGKLSSIASATSFAGSMAGGMIGPPLLAALSAGRLGALLSASALCAIAISYVVGPAYVMPLLACLVVLQLVQAIDVVNTLQQIERGVPPLSRARVHSTHQLSLTLAALIAPLLAGLAAQTLGLHAIVFAGAIFVAAIYNWIQLAEPFLGSNRKEISARFGFRHLFAHSLLRRLTMYRVLSNCAHSGTFVAIPFLAARTAPSSDRAGLVQATLLIVIAFGFAAAYWYVARMGHSDRPPFAFVLIGCIGSTVAWITAPLTDSMVIGIFACLLHGVALYCLRMAGVLTGRVITPASVFGQAVLVGDTVARFGATLVGLTVSMFLIRSGDQEVNRVVVAILALFTMSAVFVALKLWQEVHFPSH